MSTDLDLDVLPIYRLGGYDQPSVPGLHLAVPPRRTARGRASDLVILLLDVKGNAPLTLTQQNQLLSEVSKTYYQHRGSVTASMREAIGSLNQSLLDRNRSTASTGLHATGLLTMIVAREDMIYLAQAGPMHAFVVTPGDTVHIYNTQNSGRGLGVASAPSIHFFQTRMENGGLILGSPAPPPTWTAANLKASYRMRLEILHQTLINQAGPDLSAMVIKVRPGKGELGLLQTAPARQLDQPAPVAVPRPQPSPKPAPETPPSGISPTAGKPLEPTDAQERPALDTAARAALATAVLAPETPEGAAPSAAPSVVPSTEPPPLPAQEAAIPQRPPAEPAASDAGSRNGSQAAAAAGAQAPKTSGLRSMGSRLAPAALVLSQRTGGLWDRAVISARTLLGRMTPGGGIFTLPSSVMVSVAIIIPLIVVTVAFTTYLRRGLAGQHEVYLERASQAADQAAGITDPIEARTAWESTLSQVATAESYGSSEASAALHSQAQGALDQLDGIVRVAFQPALTRPFNETVDIAELVSTPEDIYMLNRADGTILRAWLSGRGYEPDPTFSCGPGVYGTITVGQLIDLAPLPKGNDFGATVLALDQGGNLIYCIPGKPPIAAPLVPPDSNWGQPSAIGVDSGKLFVLDPMTNAVWVYRGANYTFSDRPSLFFTDEIPPLATVVDMAVNRQDLYLLHTDGHITTCTGSEVETAPTRCQDPAPYSDPRPGHTAEVTLMPGTQFTKLQFTPPPDPSVYLLDPSNQSAYHFSLRLTFQRQYRPDVPLDEETVAAFNISPNRTIFYANGNEVYYANLP